MPRIITKAERESITNLRVRKWFNSKDYASKKDLYFSVLAVFRGSTITRNGDADPRVLIELLSLVLEADPTFRGRIKGFNRNANRLKTADGWAEVAKAAAALVVEDYLKTDNTVPTVTDDDLAPTREELAEKVQSLLALALETAEKAKEIGLQQEGKDSYTPGPDLRPDLQVYVESRLLELLEDEMFVLSPAGDELGIPKSERDREVAKRALVKLRITELRALAREAGIDDTGTLEQVAERLAALWKGDEALVAEMVLANEPDMPYSGFITRLVALKGNPDFARVVPELERASGNYARIGIARWFVFGEVNATSNTVRLSGVQRYFHVNPKLEYENYGLTADPRQSDVDMMLRRNVKWVEIASRHTGDTSGLALALQHTTHVRPEARLPIALKVPEGELMAWDRRTVFMLGLLTHDLLDETVTMLDTSVAHFESPTASTDADEPRRPRVKSVRLGGQQLLSSRQACEMIIYPRGLIRVSLSAAVKLSAKERIIVPVRIELADDHATVFTGLTGTTTADQVRTAHEVLVKRLRLALEREDVPQSVTNEVENIIARAAGEDPDEADIGTPPAHIAALLAGGGADGDGGSDGDGDGDGGSDGDGSSDGS